MTPAVADFVSFVVVHHPILGYSILIHIHAENIYCTFFGFTGFHRRWAWIWKGKSTLDLWVVHGWTWLSGIIRSGPGSNRIPATRPRLRRNLINGWTMTFRYNRGHVLLFAGSMFDFWRVNHADPLKIPPKETNFQTTHPAAQTGPSGGYRLADLWAKHLHHWLWSFHSVPWQKRSCHSSN